MAFIAPRLIAGVSLQQSAHCDTATRSGSNHYARILHVFAEVHMGVPSDVSSRA